MKQNRTHALLFFGACWLLTTLACAVPGFNQATPTAVPPPVAGALAFNIPTPAYTLTLSPGQKVPGARLEYLGQNGDVYQVRIDGQPANKRLGDSFVWSGVVGAGVLGEYNLRLTATLPGIGSLPVTGEVQLTVFDAQPVELTALPDLSQALHFNNIFIDTNVPLGQPVPGTDWVFTGLTTQGSTNFAQLTGPNGTASFAQGDSVVWTGQLRQNVYLRYNLRVLTLSESNLHLTGVAELWVTNPTYP